MSVFADSSALVKLYSDEKGHEAIRAIVNMVVSSLARVKVPSALWRKHRMGALTVDQAAVLVNEFEADHSGTDTDSPRLAAVRTTAAILDSAARDCAVHGLRAYDAVQLATARAARGSDPTCDQFAAFDTQLRTAAAVEGFRLTPRDLHNPLDNPRNA